MGQEIVRLQSEIEALKPLSERKQAARQRLEARQKQRASREQEAEDLKTRFTKAANELEKTKAEVDAVQLALDAILQTGYGALLDAFWSGEHSGAERVYSPLAYSRALLLYLAALTAAAAAAIYLWYVARREQRASDACSSPCSEVNERQELLLGR